MNKNYMIMGKDKNKDKLTEEYLEKERAKQEEENKKEVDERLKERNKLEEEQRKNKGEG